MDYMQKVQKWRNFAGLDPILREQLESMNEKE